MAGIKDVAELSGVSASTVSRTLNGTTYVEPETRKKVMQAVRELNYKPNLAAKNLKSGGSHLIGLIIPDIVNPYYPQILKTLEDLAVQAGYSILFCDAQGDTLREKYYFETFRQLCVDGILYVPSTEDIECARQYTDSIPMVIINRTFDIDAPCININNEEATAHAARYLLEKGHRKIAVFSNNTHRQYNAERMAGCIKAFAEFGTEDYKEYLVPDLENEEDVYRRTVELLHRRERPTAIMAFNDNMAMCIYRAVFDCGMKIPDDISVIGFDDIPTAKYMAPPLTTMRHATYDTLKIIFNNLMYQINTREFGNGSVTYYKASLVERESVKDLTVPDAGGTERKYD